MTADDHQPETIYMDMVGFIDVLTFEALFYVD